MMVKKLLLVLVLAIVFSPARIFAQGDLTIILHSITTSSNEVEISGNQIIYDNEDIAIVTIRVDCTGDIAMVNLSQAIFSQTPQCPNAPYILTLTIQPYHTEDGEIDVRVWDKEKHYEAVTIIFINNRGGTAQTTTESQTSTSTSNNQGSLETNKFIFDLSSIGGLLAPLYLFINYGIIGFGLATGVLSAYTLKQYIDKRYLGE